MKHINVKLESYISFSFLMLTQKTTNLLLVITYKPQVTQASEEVFTIKMQKHENM